MAWQPSARQLVAIRIALFAACLLPAGRLIAGAFAGSLGVNPIEFVARSLGSWTLNFLLITLLVTPARQITGLHWLLRLRRMLGLFAFFYGILHLLSYVVLDQFFDWTAIARDIVKRPFITIGFAALVLMIPLAATSTSSMVKRLGGRRWQRLHRLVYAVAVLGVTHYWWLVKKDVTDPAVYAAALAILLGYRAMRYFGERAQRPRTMVTTPCTGVPAPGRAGGRAGGP